MCRCIVLCVSQQSFLSSKKKSQPEFYWCWRIEESGVSLSIICIMYFVYLDYVRLCEKSRRGRWRQDIEEDKVYQRHPMVWPRASSLPDDAETRHHCSVSSALHIMPFLSMYSELLPPHLHEIHLQTPRSFSTIDVVPSGVNEPMQSPKRLWRICYQDQCLQFSRLRYQVRSLEEEYQVCNLLMSTAKKICYQVWV